MTRFAPLFVAAASFMAAPAIAATYSAKPATQRLTLVLEPRMTATVLGLVGGMLNGEAVLKGRSPFGDRVGEAIASPLLISTGLPWPICCMRSTKARVFGYGSSSTRTSAGIHSGQSAL